MVISIKSRTQRLKHGAEIELLRHVEPRFARHRQARDERMVTADLVRVGVARRQKMRDVPVNTLETVRTDVHHGANLPVERRTVNRRNAITGALILQMRMVSGVSGTRLWAELRAALDWTQG